jgi:hypothetical protein
VRYKHLIAVESASAALFDRAATRFRRWMAFLGRRIVRAMEREGIK